MTSVMPGTQPAAPVSPAIPVDMAEVKRKVDKAKALLILDHPFWGTAVSRRPIHYNEAVGTACMHASGQMTLAPSFIMPLTVRQVMFLLAHECMHWLGGHAFRLGHRKHGPWNIACDKVINDMLEDAKVGDKIEGGVYMRDARNYAPEELYDDTDDPQGPGGTGCDIGRPCDENGKPLDESHIRQLEAQAKVEAVQCAKAAKAVGKLPGSIERMVDELIQVKTPWFSYLERYMDGKVKDDISWRSPNRRFISAGLYLPGKDDAPRMGTVVIGVDISGSIDQAELNVFGGHANRILEECRPEKVIVVYCDTQVSHVDEYEPDDFPIQLVSHGGGGTDMEQVLRWVEDNDVEPDVTVILTDGYTGFTKDPGHDVVWLMTTQQQAPYGVNIHFDIND